MQWFYCLMNDITISLVSNFKSRDLSNTVVSYEMDVDCEISRVNGVTNIVIDEGHSQSTNYKDRISFDPVFINDVLMKKFNIHDLVRQTFGGSNVL